MRPDKPTVPIATREQPRTTLPAPELSAFIATAVEVLEMVEVEGEVNAAKWLTERSY